MNAGQDDTFVDLRLDCTSTGGKTLSAAVLYAIGQSAAGTEADDARLHSSVLSMF